VTACYQIPHFPAWAFARGAPHEPLIVVERERVVAATAVPRRKGVEPGLPIERARTLAPTAQVRVRDRGLEEAVWEEALAGLHRHTPYVEAAAPGEAFGRAPLATWRALAETSGARVGLGPDRATARLAAGRTEAAHVLAIDGARRDAFLARYAVDRLPGLGFSKELPEQLRLFGYPTLGAAAVLTRRQLDAQFGEEGAALHDLLHPGPEPPIPLYQPPPSLTAAVEFDFPCREPGELLPALEPLADELGRELRQVVARRVTVRVDVHGGTSRRATRVLFEGAADSRRVLSAARPLLLEVLGEGIEVDRLAIELGALRPVASGQGALFRERPSVYMAARGVHRRFPGAIRRAVVVYAQFPEDRVQLEPFVEARRRRAA
jgi:nucleotidyltransferase/DNA polymerase involved in DNA repair